MDDHLVKRSFLDLLRELFEPIEGERRHPQLLPYVIASLVLHSFFVLFLPYLVRVVDIGEEVVEIIPLMESGDEYRIADIEPPLTQQRPTQARFLGTHDSRVDEEQVATGERSPQTGRQGKPGEKLFDVDRGLFTPSSVAGEAGEDASQPMEDFYPDFRRGPHTYLNVLRYPDVDYFVRLKRAFKIAFNPGPVLRHYFIQNQIARGSVEVVLAVSVDAKGELSELFVLRSSDIPEYDQESMRTVKVSAPFPSPPKKFLADDGLLRMSWTFTVYL